MCSCVNVSARRCISFYENIALEKLDASFGVVFYGFPRTIEEKLDTFRFLVEKRQKLWRRAVYMEKCAYFWAPKIKEANPLLLIQPFLDLKQINLD